MMNKPIKGKDNKDDEWDLELENPEEQELYAFYMEWIANRIAKLCVTHDLFAAEVSRSIGGNKSYLQAITSQKSFPSMRRLIDICAYFDITLAEFFSDETLSPNRVNLQRLLEQLSEKDIALLIEVIEEWILKSK